LSVAAAEVPDAVARLVIQRDDIVAVGDALFTDCLSQTYRYLEETPENPND
jgi:predicted HAD superfamily phosphohydrolase YqeG